MTSIASPKTKPPKSDGRIWRPDFSKSRTWVIALMLFAGFFLHRSYFSGGTITWGDWYWISPETLKTFFRLPSMWEPSWNVGMTNGQVNIGPVYSLMALLGKLGIGAPLAERLLVIWPMSFLPFLAMYWFLGRFDIRPAARAAGAFLFGANSYMMSRSIQHQFIVMGAAVAPLVWTVAFDIIESAKSEVLNKRTFLSNSLLFGIFFALTVMFDVRMAIIAVVPVLIHAVTILKVPIARARVAAALAIGFALTIVLHSYWIIPTLFGGTSTGFAGKLPETPFANFYELPHALTLSDPYYSGAEPVWFSQQPVMIPLLTLPFLALGGLIVARRKTSNAVGVFAIVAILGVFFTKGQNAPLGGLYNFFFTNLPGMRLFRDSSKFAVWIAGGYAVLIGLCIDRTFNWWTGVENDGSLFVQRTRQLKLFADRRSRLSDFLEANGMRALAVAVVAAFAIAALFGARASITDNLGGTSHIVSAPAPFSTFEKTIKTDDQFGRVLWLPNIARFAVISNVHPPTNPNYITSVANAINPAAPLQQDTSLVRNMTSAPQFNAMLHLSSVKYIALETNLNSETWTNLSLPLSSRQLYFNQAVSALRSDTALTQIQSDNGVVVFRVNAPVSMFTTSPSVNVESAVAGTTAQMREIGHDKYNVKFQSSGKSTAVRMSQVYADGWQATFKVKLANGTSQTRSAQHVQTGDGMQSWIVDTAGDLQSIEGTFKYAPQQLVPLGVVISLLSLFGSVAIILFFKRRKRQVENDLFSGLVDLSDEKISKVQRHTDLVGAPND